MKIISGDDTYKLKKGNMAMWDAIDELTEEYIKSLAAYSDRRIRPSSEKVTMIAKEIVDIAVSKLEENCRAEFVFVDCDY